MHYMPPTNAPQKPKSQLKSDTCQLLASWPSSFSPDARHVCSPPQARPGGGYQALGRSQTPLWPCSSCARPCSTRIGARSLSSLASQLQQLAPTQLYPCAAPAGTQAPSDSAQCTARRAAGGWTRRAPAARRGRAAGGRWGQESWMGSRKLFAAPRCLRSGEWGRAVGRQRSGGVPAAQRQPMAAQSAWAGPVVPRSAPGTPRLAGSQPMKMAVPLCFLRLLIIHFMCAANR